MRTVPLLFALVTLLGLHVHGSARAGRAVIASPSLLPSVSAPHSMSRRDDSGAALNRSAAAGTTVLYQATFDAGGCTNAGWTAVDITAMGTYFHVDDYSGLNPADFSPLAGTKSLWCGARASASGPLCSYQSLPGYGNDWVQYFGTKNCVAVSGDGVLNVSFLATFDSEPSYDATRLEYTLDCTGAGGWTYLAGGPGFWDVAGPGSFGGAYNIGTTGPVRVRFVFTSNGFASDEDGAWMTHGAVHIDNLQVEALTLEDFEGEAVDATETQDWEASVPEGYGIYMGLFPGASLVQEDPCATDLSCVWAAISGSTANYTCGGFPAQTAVPFVNARGQYLNNEIWSPEIALVGTGSGVNLAFDVYRDVPLDNLVFYTWRVRTVVDGCAGPWQNRGQIYYGAQKDWFREIRPVGDLLDLANGSSIQVSLAVIDMCGQWCGLVGSGACHSHAPLFDNVRVVRVDSQGPLWSVRDVDQFQDNFSEDGTTTGTARADMANDITPAIHIGSIIPGDSAVVTVSDPVNGMGLDPGNGRAAVYCYVAVWPQGQPAKTGAALTQDAMRFPVVGTWTDAGGVEWTCVQLDSAIVDGEAEPDVYCVDLNDNLFTPGDTVCFFYAAKNAGAMETYAFGSSLQAQGTDRQQAAVNPSEFTILPTGGPDVLYVDGMDGRGGQPLIDQALALAGWTSRVDRYDVRAPSSLASNRPASRVKNVPVQLLGPYLGIFWDTGDLDVTLGDGTGSPEKTNDYGMIVEFLENLAVVGGVYIAGDDAPSALSAQAGAGAVAFRNTWMNYTLTTGNHRPGYGISPTGTKILPGIFGLGESTFTISGGCPLLNDFDVMTPTGDARNEITYGAGNETSVNGALLSQETNGQAGFGRVLLGGFSPIYIADGGPAGPWDRAWFLCDALAWITGTIKIVPVLPSRATNYLAQNYPNPFNPQTTIAFSLRERGVVTLKVYNVTGQLVRTLSNETRQAGPQTVVWDGRNDAGQPVSSGVYFYKLIANDFAQTRKMVLLK